MSAKGEDGASLHRAALTAYLARLGIIYDSQQTALVGLGIDLRRLSISMIAKIIRVLDCGVQLRYARTRKDTWGEPYKEKVLGKKGYWYGDGHTLMYLGRSRKDVVEKIGVCD